MMKIPKWLVALIAFGFLGSFMLGLEVGKQPRTIEIMQVMPIPTSLPTIDPLKPMQVVPTMVLGTPAPATQLPSIAPTLEPAAAMNRLVSVFAAACKKALDNPNPSPEINKIGVGCVLVASAAVTAKLTGYTVNVITDDPTPQAYMGGTCLPSKQVLNLEWGSTYFYWSINQGGLPNGACGPFHLNVINFGTHINGYYYYYSTSVNGNVEIGITKAR